MNKKHDIIEIEVTERVKAIDGKYIVCKKFPDVSVGVRHLAEHLGGFDGLAELDIGTVKAKKLLKKFGCSVRTAKFFMQSVCDYNLQYNVIGSFYAFYRGADGRNEIRYLHSYFRDENTIVVDAFTPQEMHERSMRCIDEEEYCRHNNVDHEEYCRIHGLSYDEYCRLYQCISFHHARELYTWYGK